MRAAIAYVTMVPVPSRGPLGGPSHEPALTVLAFEDHEGGIVPVLGYLADRKLTEGFRVTGRVVEWARREPASLCEWFASRPVEGGGVRQGAEAVRACREMQAGASG